MCLQNIFFQKESKNKLRLLLRLAANSSVYFLRFPFADESGILSGFSFMNESKKKYVIILIILDKLRFIIKNKIKMEIC